MSSGIKCPNCGGELNVEECDVCNGRKMVTKTDKDGDEIQEWCDACDGIGHTGVYICPECEYSEERPGIPGWLMPKTTPEPSEQRVTSTGVSVNLPDGFEFVITADGEEVGRTKSQEERQKITGSIPIDKRVDIHLVKEGQPVNQEIANDESELPGQLFSAVPLNETHGSAFLQGYVSSNMRVLTSIQEQFLQPGMTRERALELMDIVKSMECGASMSMWEDYMQLEYPTGIVVKLPVTFDDGDRNWYGLCEGCRAIIYDNDDYNFDNDGVLLCKDCLKTIED